MIFPWIRVLKHATLTIFRQQAEINQLVSELNRLHCEITAAELAYMRIGRDLMEQFLIALDTPENQDEIRERLKTGLGFYRDEIAVREEHS